MQKWSFFHLLRPSTPAFHTIFTTRITTEQCWRSKSRSATTGRSRTTQYLRTTISVASFTVMHSRNEPVLRQNPVAARRNEPINPERAMDFSTQTNHYEPSQHTSTTPENSTLQHLNEAMTNLNREIHYIATPPSDLHNHRTQSHKHNNITNPFRMQCFSHSIATLLWWNLRRGSKREMWGWGFFHTRGRRWTLSGFEDFYPTFCLGSIENRGISPSSTSGPNTWNHWVWKKKEKKIADTLLPQVSNNRGINWLYSLRSITTEA